MARNLTSVTKLHGHGVSKGKWDLCPSNLRHRSSIVRSTFKIGWKRSRLGDVLCKKLRFLVSRGAVSNYGMNCGLGSR